MAEVVDAKKMPKRLRYKLPSNGERIKFFFDEDMGGSYVSSSVIRRSFSAKGGSKDMLIL
jgi:hypothetical protein